MPWRKTGRIGIKLWLRGYRAAVAIPFRQASNCLRLLSLLGMFVLANAMFRICVLDNILSYIELDCL